MPATAGTSPYYLRPGHAADPGRHSGLIFGNRWYFMRCFVVDGAGEKGEGIGYWLTGALGTLVPV